MGSARWNILGILLLAGAVFLGGINWGLPSRAADGILFGSRAAWDGQLILKLAGPTEDPGRGADVASHASADRSVAVIVNATDAERARIVRRYRLMSYQPDEWNTLKALAEMKPGQGNFDPKLYQYGGLWVYPVGAMLKVASILHFIQLRPGMAWYLDHSEQFGKFYVVARLWSAIWGLVGAAAIFAIVRRMVGGRFFPSIAAIGFILMPVVVNMAHEAKPHLAGAVLMLLAALAAGRYAEHGRRGDALTAGGLCGAALAMVLTAVPVFCVLPLMALLRRSAWRAKILICAGAIGVGLAVYVLANPYVPINLLWHRQALQSNLGNSKAMYEPHLAVAGLKNAGYLIAAGASPLVAIVGALGAVAMGWRAIRLQNTADPAESRCQTTGLLLATPAACVIGQCLFFAAGKPGEFGRFMLVPDVFLLIAAVVALATFVHGRWGRGIGATLLVATTALPGLTYERAFCRDARPMTSRLQEGERLRELRAGFITHASSDDAGFEALRSAGFLDVRSGSSAYLRPGVGGMKPIPNGGPGGVLAVFADPAPDRLPPVDLFAWKIVLLPRGARSADGSGADVSVQAVDVPVKPAGETTWWRDLWTATPISWADKPFDVRRFSR